ncbi:putative FAD-binding domain-containing protein [Seiridium cardinale]|uniref:FAD-binding domain-containing protein n=1 Tax=Seiridium cardinale TaxID=138064 RepID=A0ABR2XGB0_9PEZI
MPLKIIIVGGGIGGLAAAGYLRAHHQVTVLERSKLNSSTEDYGLSVVANAFGLLQKAGVNHENLDTVFMTHIWARNHVNEEMRTIHFDTRSRFGGAPSVLVKRAKIQAELVRLATSSEFPGEPALIREGARVSGLDIDGGKVMLEDGSTVEGDLIVGADGIGSIVRSAIFDGEASAPAPQTHDLLLFMTKASIQDIRSDPELAFLAEPTKQAGLTTCYPPEGPQAKKRMLMYHVSPFELQVLGYTTEKEFADQFESGKTTIIKDVPASRVVDEFSTGFPRSFVNLFRHGSIDAWRIRDVPPIQRWARGKAVLIGDAAHAVTPHAGQGCNITIEDAEALGYVLRDVHSPTEIAPAIEKFVGLRKERAQYVARRSRELGNIQSEDDKSYGPIGPEAFSKIIYSYQGAEAALARAQPAK